MKHRGLGGVYQRGQVWWLYYSFRGKPVRESSGSTDRKDAVKLLKRRMGEMGKGQLHGPDMEKTTFGDLVKIIEEEYRMNERRSVPRMKTAFNFLRAHFGMSHARDITLDRLNSYVAARLDAHGLLLQSVMNYPSCGVPFAWHNGPGKPSVPPSRLYKCTTSGRASLSVRISRRSRSTCQNI